MSTNFQFSKRQLPQFQQAGLPEEKTPAAVTILNADGAGNVTPFKVNVRSIEDLKKKPYFGAGTGREMLDNDPAQQAATTAPPSAVPEQPADTSAPDYSTKILQDAYEGVQHAENDPAKKDSWWKSGLKSIAIGLSQMGPVNTWNDLAREGARAATLGTVGAIRKQTGNELARPFNVAVAKEKLKTAQSVASTQSTIAKRTEDDRRANESLTLKKQREERLTKNSKSVNDDKAKRLLISEWKGRQNYDPDDPAEAMDQASLTNRAADLGLTLGARSKDKKDQPQFSSGGVRYWVDDDNIAHAMADDKGEPVKDPEFDVRLAFRKAQTSHLKEVERIAQVREARLAQAQKEKIGNERAKIEADSAAADAYEKLAKEYDAKASAADPYSPMANTYTRLAGDTRKKAAELGARSGSNSLDQQMRGMKESDFRSFFVNAYKTGHGGADPSADEVNNAVSKWKARYPK